MTANQTALKNALVAIAGDLSNCASQMQAQDNIIVPLGAGYSDAELKADIATLQTMSQKYTGQANAVQDAGSVG